MGNSSSHPNRKVQENEYPIIWLDLSKSSSRKQSLTDLMNKNKKQFINLFFNIKDVLKFVRSLAGFQIIIPINYNKETLKKDFESLKDPHLERLPSIEEKAIFEQLEGASPEIIRSSKIYVLTTKEEFKREIPAPDDEEEVEILCNVHQMAKILQDYTILWCDSELAPEKKALLTKEFGIEENNVYADLMDVQKRILQDSAVEYHLILSQNSQINLLIDKIKNLKEVLGIYIYGSQGGVCEDQTQKIRTEETLEKLLPIIKQNLRDNSKVFASFATIFDDLDKSNNNKAHYLLRDLVKVKNRMQAKRDFLILAKCIYHQHPMLLKFEEEYDAYNKEKILEWYTQDSPIYELVNNCLRISTENSILYCRYFISDLERAIKEEFQKKEEKHYNGVVYRGTRISEAEWEKLRNSIGKEIEVYNFLSTTSKFETAKKFVTEHTEKKVLIDIIIPPLPQRELDEQGFFDLSGYSKFKGEGEILFNIRSRFQILRAESESIQINYAPKNCRRLVLFYGPQLLRKYITKKEPIIDFRMEVPEDPQCDLCGNENNLFAFNGNQTIIRCKNCLLKNSVPKNTFMLPIKRENESKEEKLISHKVKGMFLKFPPRIGLSYYGCMYKCSECLEMNKRVYYKWINPKNNSCTIQCSDCFAKSEKMRFDDLLLFEDVPYGFWQTGQEEWEKIVSDYFEKEFEESQNREGGDTLFEVQNYVGCQEYFKKALTSSVNKKGREVKKAQSYNMLGRSLISLGDYQKGLEYFRACLDIRKVIHGETHYSVANLYNSLGEVYNELGEYKISFQYFTMSLDIRNKYYAGKHHSIANSYHCLATVHSSMGMYQKALEYDFESLDIRESLFGEKHPATAASYNNIGGVYCLLGKYSLASDFFEKAQKIVKSIYGEIHPSTAVSYNNKAMVCSSLGEYQKALEYQQLALDIIISIYGKAHFNTEVSYNNIGLVYHSLGKYPIAFECFLKAVQSTEHKYGHTHPLTATSYNNLAMTYYDLGEYEKALEYYSKSLDIAKFIFGEIHPSTALSYNNIGGVYQILGEYQMALEHFRRSLKIIERIFGEIHPTIAISYNNIAMVYSTLGKYQIALEYFQKSSHIVSSIYGETHPQVAIVYNNIGEVYTNLGEYEKAKEFLSNACQKAKLINFQNPGKHSLVATSLNNLGNVSVNLGQYKAAFDYFTESLGVIEFLYGKKHLNTATSYNNIALVYSSLGEYQKAFEFSERSLEITRSVCGESHPNTADSYNNIGGVFIDLEEHRLALRYFKSSLEIIKLIFGEAHPKTGISYGNIGIAYHKLNESSDALVYLQKSLDIIKLIFGEQHPKTIDLYQDIGEVYHSLGECETALEYYRKSLNIIKFIYGETHLKTADSFENIGEVYYSLGLYEISLDYFMKSQKIKKFISGNNHSSLIGLYKWIGEVYGQMKNFRKALEYKKLSREQLEKVKTLLRLGAEQSKQSKEENNREEQSKVSQEGESSLIRRAAE